jgi:hypothetical protein
MDSRSGRPEMEEEASQSDPHDRHASFGRSSPKNPAAHAAHAPPAASRQLPAASRPEDPRPDAP